MRDRAWVVAQFAAAGVLAVLSIVGIVGVAVGMPELVFGFGGAVQAFAVFPGAVLSLVFNALVMRGHREAGLGDAEKVLLLIQACFVAGLVVMHFVPEALGALVVVWALYVGLAIVIFVVALVRTARLRELRRSGPTAPRVPTP